MIVPAIGTIATRVVIAAMNLLVVAISANYLGMAGVGTIAMIVLGITFILLFNNVVGGGGLVYLAPRHGTPALRWPAYGWAILTAGVAWLMLRSIPLVPEGFEEHTVALAFLQSIAGIHTNLLLGRERYGAQNAVLLGQVAVLLIAFVVLLQHEDATTLDYVHAAYIAHGGAALASGLLIGDRVVRSNPTSHPVIELFRQGAPAQLANGIQLLNYRYAFYLIERLQGTAVLGLWSVTTQLAESTWLVPKSLGSVLYARVSNMADMERQRDLSLAVLKVAVAIAITTIILLLVIPDALYRSLFGPEIGGIAALILWMSPGLVAMSASQALSHYLSGSGRVYHNTIGSGIGLVVTLLLGPWVIPAMGLYGAALTASAAYTSAVIYQMVVFNTITGARLRHYFPNALDMERIGTIWRRVIGK